MWQRAYQLSCSGQPRSPSRNAHEWHIAGNEENAIGKTFEFVLQELGREINTIGSKSSDIDISRSVISVKSELEKIREQLQNVE